MTRFPMVLIAILLCTQLLAVECPDHFAKLIGPKPYLRDKAGKVIAIEEGDWKGFLDKEFVLKDGTKVSYRDFDRLGPEFWQHYREDWEHVAKQIYEDLTEELDRRGIPWSKVHSDAYTPLNRYTVLIRGNAGSPLGRISNEGNMSSLEFSPATQMGIISPAHPLFGASTRPQSYLPLSWLGMTDCHACDYRAQSERAVPLADDLVVQAAYLGGDTGKADFGGIVVEGGDFRNRWGERQDRRGPRAFRISRDPGRAKRQYEGKFQSDSPDENLREAEFQIAEDVKTAATRLRKNPDRKKSHEELARSLGKYLFHTGVPVAVTVSPDGKSYDLRILPMTREKWAQVYKNYATRFQGNAVEGSENIPSLSAIAEMAQRQGFDVVLNTQSMLDFHSGVDINHSRLVLFPTGVFAREPLERHLMERDLEGLLPTGKPRVLAAIRVPEEDQGGVSLGNVSSLTGNIDISRALQAEIMQLKAMRNFLPPSQYAQVMSEKLGLLDVHTHRATSAYSAMVGFHSPTAKLQASDLRVMQKEPNRVTLSVTQQGEMTFVVVDMTTRGKTDEQIASEAIRIIESEREHMVPAREMLREAEDFLAVEKDALRVQNAYTGEELEKMLAQDQQRIDSLRQLLSRVTPAGYFQRLFKDPHAWQAVTTNAAPFSVADHAPLDGFKQRAKKAAAADRTVVEEMLKTGKSYFLQMDRPWDGRTGVESFVAEEFFKVALEGGKHSRDILVPFAYEIAENSQSNWARMHAYDMLAKLEVKEERAKKLLIEAQKSTDSGRVNWSLYALANLFPGEIDNVIVPHIKNGTPDSRTTAFGAMNKVGHYSETALLAAVDGIGLEVRGSPGAEGYIRDSKTTSPRVRAAIKDKLRKTLEGNENLDSVIGIVRGLRMHDPDVKKMLVDHAQKHPDIASQQYADLLFNIDPKLPIVRTLLEKKIQPVVDGGYIHVWNFLDDLLMLNAVDPKSPLLSPGIARIEEEQKRANHAGFKQDVFDALRKAVRGQ